MSSTTNIPTNARTMSGQIIISDGVAVLENGNLSNVSNIDTDTINTSSFSTNDFTVNTNIDLTADTSKLQFTYNSDPTNTLIDRTKVTTKTINTNNFNLSNVISSVAITNWNFGTPAIGVPNGRTLLYSGSSTYTGLSGFTASGSVYNLYIQRGSTGSFYTTYYPPGLTQCAVLQNGQNGYMTLTSNNYSLSPGLYLFSYYIQCQDTGAGGGNVTCTVYNATTSSVIAVSPTGNASSSYPNWIQFKVAFNIGTTSNVNFQFYLSTTSYIYGTYSLLTGLELKLDNGLIINDGVGISTISGSNSLLTGLNVNNGIIVNNGGAKITGGLTTGTQYGSNNLAINSTMGSGSTTNNINTIAIGTGTLQGSPASTDTIAIGVGINKGNLSNLQSVFIGNKILSEATSYNVVIGYNASGSNSSVVIGRGAGDALNGGSIKTNNVVIGSDTFQRYNGFGVLTSIDYNAVVGYGACANLADNYNSCIGAMAFYSLYGSNGVTAQGNNGYVTQYNSAIGYASGYNQQRYNKCTFLGANSDASVDNLYNSTAIGYGTIVDASNVIQLGSHGETVKISGDLAGVTTINGLPYTSSSQTLAQTLSYGNSAGTFIDMSGNNIINVNEYKVLKTTTGVGNPAILIQTNNDDANAENIVINRYSTTPAVNDNLFSININGIDSVGSSVEYARISSHIVDPTSTVQTGKLSFFARGGTALMANYEVLTLLNSLIQLNKPTRCYSGFHQPYKSITLTANTDFSTAWSEWVGSHMYINQTTNGWTMTLGLATNYNGAMCWIKNVSTFVLTLSVASGTFGGSYGNGTTTIKVQPQQTLLLVGSGTSWDVCDVLGVKYSYQQYHNTTQTTGLAGVNMNVEFNTSATGNIATNTANDTDSWGGSKLTYATGVFTNNTGYNMTVNIRADLYISTTTGIKYLWMQPNATRNVMKTIGMINLPAGGTNWMTSQITLTLCNGDSFQFIFQSTVASSIIGSGGASPVPGQQNRITITRV